MDLTCEERPSDSPFIDRIWRSYSDRAGSFISMASNQSSIVVSRYQDKTTLTVRGPETYATPAYCPADVEFVGIQFKPGAFMPNFPASQIMDRCDVNLPDASSRSFWLNSAAWEFPDFENADTFIERLTREGLLVQEPVVDAALQGQLNEVSLRSVQRRFLRATGITHNTLYQITRARHATTLLKQGKSILDTVEEAGYTDQPHMTRLLKHYIGQTPAQIIARSRAVPLSFLFKTTPP